MDPSNPDHPEHEAYERREAVINVLVQHVRDFYRAEVSKEAEAWAAAYEKKTGSPPSERLLLHRPIEKGQLHPRCEVMVNKKGGIDFPFRGRMYRVTREEVEASVAGPNNQEEELSKLLIPGGAQR